MPAKLSEYTLLIIFQYISLYTKIVIIKHRKIPFLSNPTDSCIILEVININAYQKISLMDPKQFLFRDIKLETNTSIYLKTFI